MSAGYSVKSIQQDIINKMMKRRHYVFNYFIKTCINNFIVECLHNPLY